MRIKSSMEKQKLQGFILVDDAIQKRLKKNNKKKIAVMQSLTQLRKQAGIHSAPHHRSMRGSASTPALTAAVLNPSLDVNGVPTTPVSGLGVGVWSSLGSHYQDQGGPDLELPHLNAGIP